jgi:copper homeostasis protein
MLEIIGFTVEGSLLAQKAGADRIELCDNLKEGGTTPSLGFMQQARKYLQIPIYTMIRPRGGDFLYTPIEFEQMKMDVLHCKNAGMDGIVIGLLQKDGTVDVNRTSQLVELAYPLEVTFHRAFDRTSNPLEALAAIILTGCQRILTSGQHPTALAGATLIATLIQKAASDIVIMPGSGIKSDNLLQLIQLTKATEYHASASTFTTSKMGYYNDKLEAISTGIANCNFEEVKAMKSILNNVDNLTALKN